MTGTAAPPAAPMPGVKELKWRPNPLMNWVAQSIVGQYFVFKDAGDSTWALAVPDVVAAGEFKTAELAKAAAQADFEARILSALDVPAHPEGVKAADAVNAAQRIFEIMCGGPVDWAKHAADTNEDNLFQSADWATCLAYATAALSHPEPVAQEAVAWDVCLEDGTVTQNHRNEAHARASADYFNTHGDKRIVKPLYYAHPSPSPEQGEETAALACLEELANRPLGISLEEWCRLSGPILGALQSLSALRARVAELEARATPQAGGRQ